MSCDHDFLKSLHPQGKCPVCPDVPVHKPVVQDIRARAQAAKIELSKRSLYHFLINGWHVLEPNTPLEGHWHIKTLCDHVQWMFEQWGGRVPQVTQNLDVNVPPGSLKSRIVSVYGPAWAWLPSNWPGMSFLCLSSTPTVAIRDADYNKELIESDWYRQSFNIPWHVRSDADAKGLFKTTAGGLRQSQGLNAKIVGVRCDCLLFDDPNDVKDISDVKLQQVANGYLAARNRLNDLRKGFRLVIQQRTHEKDLSGRLLASGGWDHLCIPMEYSQAKCACGMDKCTTKLGTDDPRTVPGEVLHPERNTPEVLAQEMLGMGSLAYAGQMNQRPAPEGGAMFKLADWRHYDELPRDRPGNLQTGQGVLSIDCTFGKGKPGAPLRDRCAMVVIFPKGKATRFVDYAFAERMGIKATIAKIKEVYEMYTDPRTGGPMIGKILIEKAANGEAVCEMLEDELPGIKLIIANTDKMSRANACLPTVEAGNIRLRKNAPWDEQFTAELAAFPTGAHDDYVDAFTQAITEMASDMGGNLANACVL